MRRSLHRKPGRFTGKGRGAITSLHGGNGNIWCMGGRRQSPGGGWGWRKGKEGDQDGVGISRGRSPLAAGNSMRRSGWPGSQRVGTTQAQPHRPPGPHCTRS